MKTSKCKNCGKVHLHCPFVDCYSEKDDGPLPDSLGDYYNGMYGGD